MSNGELPNRFNGKLTDYTFFDGFKESGMAMKALYIISAPAMLVIPLLIEANQYNTAKHNAKAARAFVAEQKTRNTVPASAPSTSPEPSQETTIHRDALAQQATQGRGIS